MWWSDGYYACLMPFGFLIIIGMFLNGYISSWLVMHALSTPFQRHFNAE